MQRISFLLIFPILWMISKLPFRFLYVFSDFVFFLNYYIVGYRKSVVLSNLRIAFPEKDEQELKVIRKKFYRHFTDIIFEGVKSISVSEKEILKRYAYKNTQVLDRLYDQNKSVILLASHYGNWEWIISLSLKTKHTGYATYTQLKNIFFDTLVKKIRTRFGGVCLRSENTIKNIIEKTKLGEKGIYLLISDQSPHVGKMNYWSEFMNITVPIANGGEVIAKKFNFAVVYMNTTKIRRGYYKSEFIPITLSAKKEEVNITDKYLELLENQIKNNPEFYLWSHKRFKHMDKVPEGYKKRR